MKIKGITIWEQYVDRIVLAVAVLLFVGFTTMQFIGDPNATELSGRQVGPGEIDSVLREKAQDIASRMSSSLVDVDVPTPEPMLAKFETLTTTSISPSATLALAQPAITPGGGIVAPPSDKHFVEAVVKAPYDIRAAQYFDTVLPEVVEQVPGLVERLPAAPHDLIWATVAANFDQADVLRQFSQPGPNGEAPLPLTWYNNQVYYINLQLEREEYVDGQWVNRTTIAPIPGQTDLRDEIASPGFDATKGREILAHVGDLGVRNDIIRPEFYNGVAAAWVPPSPQTVDLVANGPADEDPAAAELRQLRAKLHDLKLRQANLQKRLKDNNCPETPLPPSGGSSGTGRSPSGPSAPGASGGGLSSGGLSRSDSDSQSAAISERRCAQLRRSLANIEQQIASVEAEIKKLQPDAPELTDKKVDEPAGQEESQDVIQVWAHDITVEPGRTYRYRLVMKIYNPLFARRLDLVPEQQHLAEPFTIVSAPSDWSDPITIEPPLRVFIVQGRANSSVGAMGGAALGSARAEVYRFRNGRWWMEQFTVQPGDRIGGRGRRGAAADIDFSSDWHVLDIVENPLIDRQEADRWGGNVVLQSLVNNQVWIVRSPRDDYRDPERDWLSREVRAAEIDVNVAAN